MCRDISVFDSGKIIFNNVRFTRYETGLLTADGSNMYSSTLHNWKLWCGTFLNCQIQFSVLELTCSGFDSKVSKNDLKNTVSFVKNKHTLIKPNSQSMFPCCLHAWGICSRNFSFLLQSKVMCGRLIGLQSLHVPKCYKCVNVCCRVSLTLCIHSHTYNTWEHVEMSLTLCTKFPGSLWPKQNRKLMAGWWWWLWWWLQLCFR